PTRVLDLGDSDNKDKISLYTTSNEPATYICLSHCWGSEELLKTEKGSFSTRTEGIMWEDLPKTFQDAVTMTRALGVRYLWIDSLCIVQDDKDDWRRESAKMHTIYRDGYLTLAASKSKGPDGGLFSAATSDDMLKDWDFQEDLIRTRRKIQHFESRQEFPLLQRGWIFQERILSRRVLHFGSKGLIWECMEHQCQLAGLCAVNRIRLIN
ncbi:HET-domain-containing protein, partial [Cadophora sp. DSE1049]